jgi:hypothetical protein
VTFGMGEATKVRRPVLNMGHTINRLRCGNKKMQQQKSGSPCMKTQILCFSPLISLYHLMVTFSKFLMPIEIKLRILYIIYKKLHVLMPAYFNSHLCHPASQLLCHWFVILSTVSNAGDAFCCQTGLTLEWSNPCLQ